MNEISQEIQNLMKAIMQRPKCETCKGSGAVSHYLPEFDCPVWTRVCEACGGYRHQCTLDERMDIGAEVIRYRSELGGV